MSDQLNRLMVRVDKAIAEHAAAEPSTPGLGATFTVHAVASMVAARTHHDAKLCAAIHLRTITGSAEDALTALGRAFDGDPKMAAAIGAALMVLK